MAEAAWLAFESYFESSPELETSQRLSVSLFSDEERFQAALAAVGEDAGGAGGYYSPRTQSAYLFVQPSQYYTNVLFLHEMTHQFHYLARTGNQNRPSWYVEGLAEYLGRHDWDGLCVRLGVIPMLSLEDLPGKALESVSASGLDTSSIVSGMAELNRAKSWAIVGYLERSKGGEMADAFALYRALLDAGDSPNLSVFEELFGPTSSIDSGVAQWLPTAQEPLAPIYTEWIHVAPRKVRSLRTGLLSLAQVKQSHSMFEVTVTEQSSGAYSGVLAGFTDRSNYVAYFVGPDLRVSEFKNVNGVVSWNVVGPSVSPNNDGSFVWTVSHSGSETVVEVNGISRQAAAGFDPVSGPAAYDSESTFSGIRWH